VSLSNEISPEARAPPRKSSKTKTISAAAVVQQPLEVDSLLETAQPSDKFFGLEPVILPVNRSMERSLIEEPVTGVADLEDAETSPRGGLS
jgi:hypothetical protein